LFLLLPVWTFPIQIYLPLYTDNMVRSSGR
jgi:hypothetical protein